MKFGDAVKSMRAELGLTQTELASALNINFATVCRWESGRTSPNRSTSAQLLEYARSAGLSAKCMEQLKASVDLAKKLRLRRARGDSLHGSGELPERDAYIPSPDGKHSLLRHVMDSTPVGIALLEVYPQDVAGSLHTRFVNDYYYSFSGYSKEEYTALIKANEMHFAFEEDVPALFDAVTQICSGEPGCTRDCTARFRTKDGGFRWMLLTGRLSGRNGKLCVINVSQVDITARSEAAEKVRISEEILRLAAATDQRAIIIYNVKENYCRVESAGLYMADSGDTFSNIPQSLIEKGIVAPESEAELRSLFERVKNGEEKVSATIKQRTGPEEYQWYECNASLAFDAQQRPDRAVLVLHNINEQLMKEAVYNK